MRGNATLMGLVNDPELYRCGVDWARQPECRVDRV
jgi:hypothetical protein